jgi:uncharacterized short protein YbdD (DUF466 family)
MKPESSFLTAMHGVYGKTEGVTQSKSQRPGMTKEEFEQECIKARAVIWKINRDHDDALKAAKNSSTTSEATKLPDPKTP